jgi:hypothetical protein
MICFLQNIAEAKFIAKWAHFKYEILGFSDHLIPKGTTILSSFVISYSECWINITLSQPAKQGSVFRCKQKMWLGWF